MKEVLLTRWQNVWTKWVSPLNLSLLRHSLLGLWNQLKTNTTRPFSSQLRAYIPYIFLPIAVEFNESNLICSTAWIRLKSSGFKYRGTDESYCPSDTVRTVINFFPINKCSTFKLFLHLDFSNMGGKGRTTATLMQNQRILFLST